jgi:hypothetical protein
MFLATANMSTAMAFTRPFVLLLALAAGLPFYFGEYLGNQFSLVYRFGIL